MKSFFNHPLRLLVGLVIATAGLAHAQPVSPMVTTLPASAVGVTNATLNGIGNPNGELTFGFFQWGTTTNYDNVTPAQSLGSGGGNVPFNRGLTNLSVGVTYHFRAVVSNSFYVVSGTNQSFTTPLFTDIGAGLARVFNGSVAWGDYDNDGRLDILLAGTTNVGGAGPGLNQVWRNTGSGFTNINAGLPGVWYASVAWGDYDNDGRLDILLTGMTNLNPLGVISQVWRNTGSGFTDIHAGLPGVFAGAVAWADYDNDGRLDLLLTGTTNGNASGVISQVWRNTGSGFTNINAGLPGVWAASVAWGDYDNDGRLDLLLAGLTPGSSLISQVWRNTGGGFTNINAGLPGVYNGSVAWGDYDSDGRLDILLTGNDTNNLLIAQLWRNTGGGFTNSNANLPGVYYSSVAWGDYDNDGRLDFLLTGLTDISVADSMVSQIWRNNTAPSNTPPTAPSGLNLVLSNSTATLTWNAAADGATPAPGLTYNLRIGTTPGGADVLAPMSGANGFRRLPQLGNAQPGLTAIFNFTLGTPYYWSVQAVDSAFAGSPFAPESSFKLQPVQLPVTATNVTPGDLNGDGIVDQNELNTVLTNYFSTSPFLQMTNVAGLGGTNVTFALTNDLAGAFSVEYTTNLVNWLFLGPATPRYLFTDTNAPAVPQRYYRLRWP